MTGELRVRTPGWTAEAGSGPLARALGAFAGAATLVLAFAVTLLFAATLAVIGALMAALLAAGALALRLGRGRPAGRLGHCWIVYAPLPRG